MAAKRKRNNQDAAVMTDGGKPSSASVGSDDEFADDDREPTEAVAPDGSIIKLPQKKFYRQRAHANPLADHGFDYPSCPATMNWHAYYPTFFNAPAAPGLGSTPSGIEQVEFADIGCGFGGLTIALAELFPTKVVLGMEIRHQVTAYVRDRIAALRLLKPGSFQNASVIRGNAMKFLTNFFAQGQLSKLFFCFPDPHFKSRKHKQRIISTTLLAEYAYVLRPGGIVYCITDVLDLHLWTERHFLALPDLFEPILPDSAEYQADPCVAAIRDSTEEGKKVARNNGEKYILVWRRKENPKHESAGWVL